jgi:DUF4097 and DUF4098 domain-containing protein YvlB
MTDRTETHEVEGRPHVTLELKAGDVRFREGKDNTVVLQFSGASDALDAITVDVTGDAVSARSSGTRRRWGSVGGSVDTVVTLPPRSDVTVALGAGDVVVGVPVRDLRINVASGDLRIDDVDGTTEIKVGSGDVRAGLLAGNAKVASASGDVRIDRASELSVSTAAGDLYLGAVSDAAQVKSATGDVRIGSFSGSDLEIKTMSGDVTVGLVQGMVVNAAVKTMSGDFRNRIKPTSGERVGTMSLTITSFSGDVTLRSAK